MNAAQRTLYVRLNDDVWNNLPRDERNWRFQAWSWNHHLKPGVLGSLRVLEKGYRLLEPEDLLPPWTPELMGDSIRLSYLSAWVMEPDEHGVVTQEEQDECDALRAKFIAAGIDSMEDFFEVEKV